MKRLKKYALALLLLSACTLPVTAQVNKQQSKPVVAVAQVGGVLTIKAANVNIQVFSILGNLIFERKQAQEEISLNLPKGYYIVKAGETVQKIAVR